MQTQQKTQQEDKRKTAALSFLTSISTAPLRSSPVFVNPSKPSTSEDAHRFEGNRDSSILQFLGNIEINATSNLTKAVSTHGLGQVLALDLAELENNTSPITMEPLALITSHQMEAFKNGQVPIPDTWNESRMILCSLNGSLTHVFSVIHMIDKSKPKRVMTKGMFGGSYFERMGLGITLTIDKKRKAESFAHLLEPCHSLGPKSALNTLYNPDYVDDPEFQTGRNKTVITLPCFKGSIIQHWKASEVNKAQNEYLKERLPGLDPNITLGEIRELKSRILEIGTLQDLELSSIASAFVFFEKLLVKNFINYSNRKIVAGNCLLLAAKVNDPKELDYTKVLEAIDRILDVSSKEIYTYEFPIYAALEFALFTSSWEIDPHIDRILSKKNMTLEEYLGMQHNKFYSIS